MKKKTTARLKKDLDMYFSRWIRLRDSKNGVGNCYTCGKSLTIKKGQCGHFIPRNILITRWEPDNCKMQCVGCNVWGNGKILDFEDHLVKDLGRKRVDALKASRFQIMKVDSVWYEKEIERYKKEVEKLSAQK